MSSNMANLLRYFLIVNSLNQFAQVWSQCSFQIPGTTFCSFCDFDYFSRSGTLFNVDSSDCIQREPPQIQDQNIYVANTSTECFLNKNCDGSQSAPFATLLEALVFIHADSCRITKKNYVVNIVSPITSVPKTSESVSALFRHCLPSIVIQPSQELESQNVKPLILWKTDKLPLFINANLLLRKVTLDGIDLNLDPVNQNPVHDQSRCKIDDISKPYDYKGNLCGLDVPQTAGIPWNRQTPFALFNLEHLVKADGQSAGAPQLILDDVLFQNFFPLNKETSYLALISLSPRVHPYLSFNLQITNTELKRNGFWIGILAGNDTIIHPELTLQDQEVPVDIVTMKSTLVISDLLIDEYNPYGLFYEREVIDLDVALLTILEILGSGHIENISVRNTRISRMTFLRIKGYELFQYDYFSITHIECPTFFWHLDEDCKNRIFSWRAVGMEAALSSYTLVINNHSFTNVTADTFYNLQTIHLPTYVENVSIRDSVLRSKFLHAFGCMVGIKDQSFYRVIGIGPQSKLFWLGESVMPIENVWIENMKSIQFCYSDTLSLMPLVLKNIIVKSVQFSDVFFYFRAHSIFFEIKDIVIENSSFEVLISVSKIIAELRIFNIYTSNLTGQLLYMRDLRGHGIMLEPLIEISNITVEDSLLPSRETTRSFIDIGVSSFIFKMQKLILSNLRITNLNVDGGYRSSKSHLLSIEGHIEEEILIRNVIVESSKISSFIFVDVNFLRSVLGGSLMVLSIKDCSIKDSWTNESAISLINPHIIQLINVSISKIHDLENPLLICNARNLDILGLKIENIEKKGLRSLLELTSNFLDFTSSTMSEIVTNDQYHIISLRTKEYADSYNFRSCLFSSITTSLGGLFGLNQNTTLNLSESVIDGFHSYAGSIIIMQQNVSSVKVINSVLRDTFLGVDATFGIFTGGCSVFIDGLRVENFSNQSQGRLFDLFMSSLEIRNSRFSRVNGNQGALLNLDKSNFTIQDSVFIDLGAKKFGLGGICLMKGGSLNSTNVLWGTIESAANGVIFFLENLEKIEINNNTFDRVKILQGLGLIHIVNREPASGGKNLIKNSIFTEFRGEGQGGAAIYVADDSIKIMNSTLRDNHSPLPLILGLSSLGKIQDVEILNCTFQNNDVLNLISVDDDFSFGLISSSIIDNFCFQSCEDASPGSVNLIEINGAETRIQTSLFYNNTAQLGFKYIYGRDGRLSMVNVTMKGRSSDTALLCDSCSKIEINNSIISGFGRSAIDLVSSYLIVNNCTLAMNIGYSGCGVIRLSQSSADISGTTFSENLCEIGASDIWSFSFDGSTFLKIVDSKFHSRSVSKKISIQRNLIVDIENTMFETESPSLNPEIDFHTSVYLMDIKNISLNNVNLTSNHQLQCLHVRQTGTNPTYLIINGSRFHKCSSHQSGGALRVEGWVGGYINFSLFENNFARISGGGLSYECDDSKYCNLTVKRTVFQNNIALHAGGAVTNKRDVVKIDRDTVFSNNSASYGNDLNGPLVFVNLGDPAAENQEISSGDRILDMKLELRDFYNQLMIADDISKGELIFSDSENTRVLNPITYAKRGILEFSDVFIRASPSRSYDMKIKVDSSDGLTYERILMQIKVKPCFVGDIFVDNLCFACEEGTFTFSNDSSFCNPCPENCQCLGRNLVYPNRGYWRASTNSSLIIQCVIEDVCQVKNNTAESVCIEGYRGPLCSYCDDGLARSKRGECGYCSSRIFDQITFVLKTLVLILYLTYEVFTSLKNQFESKPVEACVSVLTSHIQTLGLFDAISMQWNNVVVEFFGISSGVTNIDLSIYSDECIYGDLLKGRSRLFLSNIVIIATPFFYWILMVLIWFVKHLVVKGGLIRRKTNRFKQNQSDELQTKNTTGSEEPPISPEKRAMGTEVTPKRIMEFKNTLLKPQLPFQYKFLSIFGLIINLMFPLLVKSAITNLQCIQLDSREPDKTYLKISPEITCWEGQHLAVVLWIGLPLLIFFGFIYPIFLATILYASAKSLTKPNYVYAFSFAFINYKRERYFWHSFMYFRSVSLLVITSASVDLGLTSRSSFLLSMCVLFYLLNTAARPFIEDEINKLQQISSLCILITVAAAILSVSGGTVGAFVSWFAFSINIGFIFWWLKCYMRLKKKMRALSMNEDKNKKRRSTWLQKMGFKSVGI